MNKDKIKPELIQLTDQVIDWRPAPSASCHPGSSKKTLQSLVKKVLLRFLLKNRMK